jgi:RNA polymerase sigma factor (TIGR02999 family)
MGDETPGTRDITRILGGAEGLNREEILERLAPIVYDELRVLAAAKLRGERPDHSLQPTALVNEAYLRMVGGGQPPWRHRAHFFHAAAEAMRRILIDHARKRARVKRGGGGIKVALTDAIASSWDHPDRFLALDEAIRRLEGQDARSADVVRLRFYAGLSVQETAGALGLSERTVDREWAFARAWLHDALSEGED